MSTGSKRKSAPQGQARRYMDAQLTKQRHRNNVPIVLTLLSAMVYLGWLVRVIDWNHPWVCVLFMVSELICLGSVLLWALMLYSKRLHPPGGLPGKGKPMAVDILLTVCGEPIAILRRSFMAASKIDYPNYQVTVCDDGNNPEVKQLAQRFRFHYTTRKTKEFAKSGNLNHGLKITSAPLVMTLDADQVTKPEILDRLTGFFRVPKIAYVTSRQDFVVPPGDPWGNKDLVFYKAMQTGKNDSNSAISTGSSVIYRRKALESIGGFATWSMVEDLYTSMCLSQKGWHSVYYPYPLSKGTAPLNVYEQYHQRWQWAVDSMRIFFWRNPLFAKGLSPRQRLNYFHFGYHYLMYGIAYPIFFALPAWSLFTGNFFLTAPVWVFLCYRAPYLIFMKAMNRSMTHGRLNMKAFQMQAGLWPVYLLSIVAALFFPRVRPKYRVTQKGEDDPDLLHRLAALLPNLTVIFASLAAIGYGWRRWQAEPSFLWVNIFWCLWAVNAVIRFTWVGLFPDQMVGSKEQRVILASGRTP